MGVQNLRRYNKGYKYLMTCIDIFSKYAWVVPLKTKQGQELVKAYQTILASGRKPSKLQTDQGTELLNRVFQKFLRENNSESFTVKSGLKASVVKRFKRTFKTKMYKYFTAKNTLTYLIIGNKRCTSTTRRKFTLHKINANFLKVRFT